MKIVVAPDSYKGSLSSVEAAHSIAQGVLAVFPQAEVVQIPVADGGEGTLEALLAAAGGTKHFRTVADPLDRSREACFLVLPGGTCVVEMAAASGLMLLSREERDPLRATTRGTGQLILAALDLSCRDFLVAIGGSATNDGGAGMAQALGASLLDRQGRELPPGGAALAELDRIDMAGFDRRVGESSFLIASDVDNPLCGPRGASAVFGPQKGATEAMVAQLDEALKRYGEVLQRDLGQDVAELPGAGAAGGLGAGLMAFCGAKRASGIDRVLDLVDFDSHLAGADLVITGEGRLDGQTAFGKVPLGVARRVKARCGVPVLALGGSLGPGARDLYGLGIDAMAAAVASPMDLEEAMARASQLVADCAERALRCLKAGGFGRD